MIGGDTFRVILDGATVADGFASLVAAVLFADMTGDDGTTFLVHGGGDYYAVTVRGIDGETTTERLAATAARP